MDLFYPRFQMLYKKTSGTSEKHVSINTRYTTLNIHVTSIRLVRKSSHAFSNMSEELQGNLAFE